MTESILKNLTGSIPPQIRYRLARRIEEASLDEHAMLREELAELPFGVIYRVLHDLMNTNSKAFNKLLSITLGLFEEKHPFAVDQTGVFLHNLLGQFTNESRPSSRSQLMRLVNGLINGCENNLKMNLILAANVNEIDDRTHIYSAELDGCFANHLSSIEGSSLNRLGDYFMRDIFITTKLPICLEQMIGQFVRSNRWNDIETVYLDLLKHDRLNQEYVDAFEKALGGFEKIIAMHKPVVNVPDYFNATMMLMRKYGPDKLLDHELRQELLNQLQNDPSPPYLISAILVNTYSYSQIEFVSDFIFDNINLILDKQIHKPVSGLAEEAHRRGGDLKLLKAVVDCARDVMTGNTAELIDLTVDTEVINSLLKAEKTGNDNKLIWLKKLLCDTVNHLGLDKTPDAFRNVDAEAFDALWACVAKVNYEPDQIARLYPASKRLMLGESFGL